MSLTAPHTNKATLYIKCSEIIVATILKFVANNFFFGKVKIQLISMYLLIFISCW